MAGMFDFFNYTKPGKGVEKNEPEKKGIERFAQLYFRKFWKYLQLNILYFLTCIPALLLYWFLFVSYFLPSFQSLALSQPVTLEQIYLSVNILAAASAIIVVLLFGGSPCAAGFQYILRNYVREEHSWLWSDFWRRSWQNRKQAFAMFAIDLAVVNLLLFGIRFYHRMTAVDGPMHFFYVLLLLLVIFVFVIYAVMHQYIWTMIVTFELKLKQIVKNAFLLTVMAFPRNILFMIVSALFSIAVYALYYLAPLVGVAATVFLLLSVYGLITQMFSYPVIRKFMLDPLEQAEEESAERTAEEENLQTNEEQMDRNRMEEPEERVFAAQNDVANLFHKRLTEDDLKTISEKEDKEGGKDE